MIYLGFEDVLAIAILALSVLSIYIAFDITRITRGAPRAWYVMIGGFTVLLVFRIVQLYYDVQSPQGIISVEEASISLLAGTLFVVGLLMLSRSFRAQQRAAHES